VPSPHSPQSGKAPSLREFISLRQVNLLSWASSLQPWNSTRSGRRVEGPATSFTQSDDGDLERELASLINIDLTTIGGGVVHVAVETSAEMQKLMAAKQMYLRWREDNERLRRWKSVMEATLRENELESVLKTVEERVSEGAA